MRRESLSDHALSIFPSSSPSRERATQPPITNSFASYRRAYNDYSNRFLRETSGTLRGIEGSPSMPSAQTGRFRATRRVKLGRGRRDLPTPFLTNISRSAVDDPGHQAKPIAVLFRLLSLSLYLSSARRVDALTEKGEARVSRGMLFAAFLRRRARSPAKSAAAIRGTCVSKIHPPFLARSSSSLSSEPAGTEPFIPVSLSSHASFTRLSFRSPLVQIVSISTCPDRRISSALSSNLRRSEVRAAGSCSRFNTSGVRTARPMHYEGAPVHELREKSLLWLRNEKFSEVKRVSRFSGEFLNGKKLPSFIRVNRIRFTIFEI